MQFIEIRPDELLTGASGTVLQPFGFVRRPVDIRLGDAITYEDDGAGCPLEICLEQVNGPSRGDQNLRQAATGGSAALQIPLRADNSFFLLPGQSRRLDQAAKQIWLRPHLTVVSNPQAHRGGSGALIHQRDGGTVDTYSGLLGLAPVSAPIRLTIGGDAQTAAIHPPAALILPALCDPTNRVTTYGWTGVATTLTTNYQLANPLAVLGRRAAARYSRLRLHLRVTSLTTNRSADQRPWYFTVPAFVSGGRGLSGVDTINVPLGALVSTAVCHTSISYGPPSALQGDSGQGYLALQAGQKFLNASPNATPPNAAIDAYWVLDNGTAGPDGFSEGWAEVPAAAVGGNTLNATEYLSVWLPSAKGRPAVATFQPSQITGAAAYHVPLLHYDQAASTPVLTSGTTVERRLGQAAYNVGLQAFPAGASPQAYRVEYSGAGYGFQSNAACSIGAMTVHIEA